MRWKNLWLKLLEKFGKRAALISLSVVVGAGSVGAGVGAGTYRVSDYDYHSETEPVVQIIEPEPEPEPEVVEMAPEIDSLFSDEEEDETDEVQELTMVGTSIEKDLKIKIQNQKNKLVTGEEFHISVLSDKKGAKASEYKDDDKDGIIYIKEIEAGDYTVTLEEIEGYEIKTASIKVTVKDQIEYKKVDVADEIKKESEVNTAVEDTAVNDVPVESTVTPMTATSVTAVPKSSVKKPDYTKTETKASVSGENTVTFEKKTETTVSSVNKLSGLRALLASFTESIFKGAEVRAAEATDVEKAQVALEEAQKALEKAQAADEAAKANLDAAQEALADKQSNLDLDGLKKNLEEKKAALENLEGTEDVDALNAAVIEAQNAVKEAEDTLAELQNAVKEAQTAADQAAKDLTAAQSAEAAAKEALDAAKKAAEEAKTETNTETNTETEAKTETKTEQYSMTLPTTALLYDSATAASNSVSLSLKITGSPTIKNNAITWASDNTKVCTVSGSGTTATVTKAGKGTATVTASLVYDAGSEGEKKVSISCAVTVKDAVVTETLTNPSAELTDTSGVVVYLDKSGSTVAQAKDYDSHDEFYKVVANGNVGIDVSKYQGSIDWSKVAASGISYVIIRAGYRGASQGSLVVDPYFKQNIQGATKAGLKVGVYFFTQAVNEAEAVEEASMVLSLVSGYRLALPIFIDTENASGGRANGLGVSARTAVCQAFCKTIQNGGYKAGVYASKSWFNSKLTASSLSGYHIWVAQYNSTLTYTGKHDIWQYTSSGSVSGISGRVDMNIAYTSY